MRGRHAARRAQLANTTREVPTPALAPGLLLQRPMTTRLATLALGLHLLACAAPEGAAPSEGGGDGKFDGWEVPPQARAVLEIHALDLWAQPLPGDATLRVVGEGGELATAGFPVARAALHEPGSYVVELAAPDHEPLTVVLDYDGSRDEAGLVAHHETGEGRAGLAVGHRTALADGDAIAVHVVFLGLRHRWFSASGRPARRGNAVELLLDGEETWSRVRGDLAAAADTIHIATWWWESDFELVRPTATHSTLSEEQRRANTVMAILEASPATKRALVGQFVSQDGVLSGMTADDPLRAKGAAAGDGFEFMGQANETSGVFNFEVEPFSFGQRVRLERPGAAALDLEPEAPIAATIPPRLVDLTEMPLLPEINHASYHQKFMLIDSDLAYVGGMNLRRTDWDSSEHRVFDHRRMLFDATTDERLAVAAGEAVPDLGPRKDYMVRIQGPSAQDAAEVFRTRWEHVRAEGATYAWNASGFEVDRAIPPVPGGVQVQITTTLPEPFWEHSIAESWLNAVANAEEYILIEDQYFRAPMLNEAILARMAEVPGLRLVVITKPIDEWTDPGCFQTYAADEAFRQHVPGRYLLLQLRSFDSVVTWGWDETEARFVDIDVHSKLLVVDDVFLSVGSANKNNRGMIYEGEMNAAVLDGSWVRAARRRILENVLGPGVAPADDAAAWWAQLEAAAAVNGAVADAWDAEGGDLDLDGAPLPAAYTPRGFAYPLAFRSPDYCLIEDVGEDMFKRGAGR